MSSSDLPSVFHYGLVPPVREADGRVNPFTYTFHNFFHPFVSEMIEQLNRTSVKGMLDPEFQSTLSRDVFSTLYTVFENPGFTVKSGKEEIDLSSGGPYANYNWELLFHVPLTIAVHLSKNQRFSEAQHWFHLIFDPTSTDTRTEAPQRFWGFLPFREKEPLKRIEYLLRLLSTPEKELSDDDRRLRAETLAGYAQSMDHPFEPFRVAATRPLAYQYWVVMKYLDCLIAWGDSLFLEGTNEALGEATTRYVLARNILGPRPQELPSRGTVRPKTFAQLKAAGLDAMGNAMVELEGHFPFNQSLPKEPQERSPEARPLFGIGRSLYFCIPRNEKLLNYWTVVDDRLFKIRHCMDIQGTVRQLPQFDSPLDPGMLVKAAGAGLDVSSIVSGLSQPPGPVRAVTLIQKSLELCAEVRGLGTALLAAMEKRDGERLARLHARHELTLQQMSKEVAFLRLKQSQEATESLLRNRQSSMERYRFYQRLLGLEPDAQLAPETLKPDRMELTEKNFDSAFATLVGQFDKTLPLQAYPRLTSAGAVSPAAQSGASGLGDLHLSTTEQAEMSHSQTARDLRLSASIGEVIASVLTFIPEFKIELEFFGIGGSSTVFGGSKISDAVKIAAEIQRTAATWESDQAGIAGRTAGHERRVEEWTLQANLAAHELMNIGRQVVSSLLAEQIARHEYLMADTRIGQASEIEQFLRDGKQTNEELYTWMHSELARLYYEYYRFAVETARRAEGAMKRELMRAEVDSTTFVRYNYWDRGREGLLAADALQLDLKRMELAYHDNNRREYEMTRHVSLRQLSPLALLSLKITGSCEVSIPESFYDRECPGHFMRRLKSVAMSVPAVVGQYTSINCTLTLLRSQIRTSSLTTADDYPRKPDSDDRFVDYIGSAESVVTSGAVADGGRFEPNLNDERFQPFELRGAVGTWRIELPGEFRSFNYHEISDLVLHIRYTARSGGTVLKDEAIKALSTELATQNASGLALFYSIPHDFPNEWSAFVAGQPLTLTIPRNHFPYMVERKALHLGDLKLYVPDGKKMPTHLPPSSVKDELNDPAGSATLTLSRAPS